MLLRWRWLTTRQCLPLASIISCVVVALVAVLPCSSESSDKRTFVHEARKMRHLWMNPLFFIFAQMNCELSADAEPTRLFYCTKNEKQLTKGYIFVAETEFCGENCIRLYQSHVVSLFCAPHSLKSYIVTGRFIRIFNRKSITL